MKFKDEAQQQIWDEGLSDESADIRRAFLIAQHLADSVEAIIDRGGCLEIEAGECARMLNVSYNPSDYDMEGAHTLLKACWSHYDKFIAYVRRDIRCCRIRPTSNGASGDMKCQVCHRNIPWMVGTYRCGPCGRLCCFRCKPPGKDSRCYECDADHNVLQDFGDGISQRVSGSGESDYNGSQ